MDIVLHRPDHAWIIELERGSRDVGSTRARILTDRNRFVDILALTP